MHSLFDKIEEAGTYLERFIVTPPRIAIVLGSGLGQLTEAMNIDHRVSYADIPHFVPVTVHGHEGELIFGSLNGKRVVAQSGRYHYYEGYDMKQVTLPIRVFKKMGATHLIIASATGGIHTDYIAGDVTVVNDHINLHHENPLHGPNDERLGVRFPDMIDAYDPVMIRMCHEIAAQVGIDLYNSIYGGLPGPNLETKAEYKYLHHIGATVVGMSTVPEVIVAQHCGLRSCVLTAVTNKCYPVEEIKKVTHEEVVRVAQMTEQKITTIVKQLVQRI